MSSRSSESTFLPFSVNFASNSVQAVLIYHPLGGGGGWKGVTILCLERYQCHYMELETRLKTK